MTERGAGAQQPKGVVTPEALVLGFSVYGLSLRLLNDSLHIGEMNLPRKSKLKLPFGEGVSDDTKDQFEKLAESFGSIPERYNFDQTWFDVSDRETHLGHVRPAVRFAEYIRSPHRRFRALLHTGSSFMMPHPDVEEALKKARATAEEVGPLKEKVGDLAWCGIIDKQLGKTDSRAFDAADIAFKELTDQANLRFQSRPHESFTIDFLRDASIASTDIAVVASELGIDPVSYLTVGKLTAANIGGWSAFVDAMSRIARTESSLGLDYKTTLVRLKEKITVEDENRIHDSNIHFWIQVVELEKSIGADWQKSLEHVRGLCTKLSYPYEVAQAYRYIAEFEAMNNLDPSESLEKAEKAWNKMGRMERQRWRTMDRIRNMGEEIAELPVPDLSDDTEPPSEEEQIQLMEGLGDALKQTLEMIKRRRNRDERTEGYLVLASEVSLIGINPLDLIDLAKHEVYTSSHRPSYAHRLRMLGDYQRRIGNQLHKMACEIINPALGEELEQAFELALESEDRYPLVGIGAHIPVRRHEAVIQSLDPVVQDRVRRDFSYGAALSQ